MIGKSGGSVSDPLGAAKGALEKHKKSLLAIPGCTGVAIGFKQVRGKESDRLAIIVFVKQKRAAPHKMTVIPRILEGVPTDVVEQEVLRADLLDSGPGLAGPDPFARYDELFCGLSVTPSEASPTWGSVGCFIRTPGDLRQGVKPGDYLMTCQHVLRYVTLDDQSVIQPSDGIAAPRDYLCGNYVQGYQDATRDCAIVNVGFGRTFKNAVPDFADPHRMKQLSGVAAAAPGQEVYKYGATTRITKGRVALVNYNPPNTGFQNVILIRSEQGERQVWVAKGDSGSVTMLQSNDCVIGLNFAGTRDSVMKDPPQNLEAYPAYYRGFAYEIQTQMDAFSTAGAVTLAS